ncbi:MAG: type 2 isopentenyl-diphosphate Delta-isomerase, partial [Spirochaetaceae bacterium]
MAEINGGSQAADQHNIAERKAQHLDICIDQNKYQVESGSTRLNEVHFIHNALPELDVNQIDTSTEFLGNRMSLPFFISSMTGGSEHGFRINKELALAAQAEKIGVGMGSIRILLRQPEVFEHFTLRKL